MAGKRIYPGTKTVGARVKVSKHSTYTLRFSEPVLWHRGFAALRKQWPKAALYPVTQADELPLGALVLDVGDGKV